MNFQKETLSTYNFKQPKAEFQSFNVSLSVSQFIYHNGFTGLKL